MIYANISSLTVLLTRGIVYIIMLLQQFKSRLDKFWQHQKLIYNYRSDLHEPGAKMSLIGNFGTCINKVYVINRLRKFTKF